jgi:hypothetical protein
LCTANAKKEKRAKKSIFPTQGRLEQEHQCYFITNQGMKKKRLPDKNCKRAIAACSKFQKNNGEIHQCLCVYLSFVCCTHISLLVNSSISF